MGVCNACESLLVDAQIADQFLPDLAEELSRQELEIRGDPATCQILPHATPVKGEDYSTEYLGPILSVKIVTSLDEAVDFTSG